MPSRIGVENQLPEDLHHAMGVLIEKHPQWDEYRLLPEPAGMAGFLFQQGCKDPSAVRHHLGGLFPREFCKL